MAKIFLGLVLGAIGLYWLLSRTGRIQPSSQSPSQNNQSAPSPKDITDAEVMDLLARGRKIDAIARYREIHQVDIKTAKEMVDLLERIGQR